MKYWSTFLLLAGFTINTQAQTNCGLLHDSNANGFVDIEDFLSILGLFGDYDSDGDGLYDSLDNCTNQESCNYMDTTTETCLFLDALGTCGGNCPLDENADGICDVFLCSYPISYWGYEYSTVQIGDQCWFAENLRSELYQNGDSVPAGLDGYEWTTTNEGAVAIFGEGNNDCEGFSPDGDACDESWSLNMYGRLYNGFAVNDDRNLCPSGWHVPTDEEWMSLEIFLGMSEVDANSTGWRGTDQGTQLKTNSGWANDGNGTNSVGFSGLPGGDRVDLGGMFYHAGYNGHWWSSTTVDYSEPGFYLMRTRWLNYSKEEISRGALEFHSGVSVRCIQDAE